MKAARLPVTGFFFIMATLLLLGCQTEQTKRQTAKRKQNLSSVYTDESTTDSSRFQPLISEFIPESSLLLEKLLEYPTQLQDANELLQRKPVGETARLSLAAALACRLHLALLQQNKSQALVYQKALQSYAKDLQLEFLYPMTDASIDDTPIDSLLTLSREALNQEQAQRFLLNHYHSPYPAIRYVLSMWLEQLYLSCLIFEHHPKATLKKHLAEQKIYLGSLMMYLSFYDQNQKIQRLHKQLEKLMQAFDPITITYEYRKPTTEVKGNVLVVKQNDLMSFRVQEGDIIHISETVEKVRNYLLQQP